MNNIAKQKVTEQVSFDFHVYSRLICAQYCCRLSQIMLVVYNHIKQYRMWYQDFSHCMFKPARTTLLNVLLVISFIIITNTQLLTVPQRSSSLCTHRWQSWLVWSMQTPLLAGATTEIKFSFDEKYTDYLLYRYL